MTFCSVRLYPPEVCDRVPGGTILLPLGDHLQPGPGEGEGPPGFQLVATTKQILI